MNVQEFLSEWDAIRGNSGLTNTNVDTQLEALKQWVIVRKDIATQAAKNKFWADLFTGITDSLKREIAKLAPEKQEALSPVSEVLDGLDAAMAKHRQLHGIQDAADKSG